jgi:hypothetical protein
MKLGGRLWRKNTSNGIEEPFCFTLSIQKGPKGNFSAARMPRKYQSIALAAAFLPK